MSLGRMSIATAFALGLTAAATASAGLVCQETVWLTPADQSAAHSATLRRSDLEPTFRDAWLAVRTTQAPALPGCPGSDDMSRFVITGVANRRWLGGAMEVDTRTFVVEAPWMLRGEWQSRTHGRPALACVRRELSAEAAAEGGRVVSFGTVPLPRIAPYRRGFRMVVDWRSRGIPDRTVVETIAMGRGRTTVWESVTGLLDDEEAISNAALGYAELLIGRMAA